MTQAPAGPARASPAVEEMQTILAVDDDDAILRLMRADPPGRSATGSSRRATGREALAKVREAMPDLVILDGMLPEVHGFEICRQLKTSERFRHIPVIMVSAVHTGWRFAADVKEKYGADDYLEKPFEPAELLRRVETLLEPRPGRSRPTPRRRRASTSRTASSPSSRSGSTTPSRPSRAASPSTSSTTCSTTTWR